MADRRDLEQRLGIGAFKQRMPRPERALPGRDAPMALQCNAHRVLGRPLRGRFDGYARAQFGMGCFWGAERHFWSMAGVYTTAVGYAGGFTPNPTYREVCSGETGHAEVVLVVYDAAQVGFDTLLRTFWENHDPTQGMRQGNDFGTQYRSVIHCDTPAQYAAAVASREAYRQRLDEAARGPVTTGIVQPAPVFFYAEDEHQQYLARHPDGYCGPGGTGAACPAAGAD